MSHNKLQGRCLALPLEDAAYCARSLCMNGAHVSWGKSISHVKTHFLLQEWEEAYAKTPPVVSSFCKEIPAQLVKVYSESDAKSSAVYAKHLTSTLWGDKCNNPFHEPCFGGFVVWSYRFSHCYNSALHTELIGSIKAILNLRKHQKQTVL